MANLHTYKAVVKNPSANSRYVIRIKDSNLSSAIEQVQKAIKQTTRFYQIQSITRIA